MFKMLKSIARFVKGLFAQDVPSINRVADTVRNIPTVELPPLPVELETAKVPRVVKPRTPKVTKVKVDEPRDPQEIKVLEAIELIKSEGGKVNITNIAKHAKVSTTVVKKYFKK